MFWKWILAGPALAAKNPLTVRAGAAWDSGTQATVAAAMSEMSRE